MESEQQPTRALAERVAQSIGVVDSPCNCASVFCTHGLRLIADIIESALATHSGWLPIEAMPKDRPIWVYGPTLMDQDYNPDGIVEAYWLDDHGWVGAVWNNEQDCWDALVVHPTHGMIPSPPKEELG